MPTDTRKEAILEALYRFINQRPGLEYGNYGDLTSYRAEVRSIGKDLKQARELLRAVERHSSITADDLIKAAEGAFSGRLTIEGDHEFAIGDIRIEYCTGQYWPTEYRRAVCAVLASALRNHVREHCMPAPVAHVVEWNSRWNGTAWICDSSKRVGIHEACRIQQEHKDQNAGIRDLFRAPGSQELMRAGDWLRRYFRREFGRGIQSRWFN